MSEDNLNKLALEAAEELINSWCVGNTVKTDVGEHWEFTSARDIADALKPFLLKAFRATRSYADGI